MTGDEKSGTVNVFLGTKSCYTASHYLNSIDTDNFAKSIFVDFKHNIVQKSVQTEKNPQKDVLWDNKVIKLETSSEDEKEIDCYSSNPELEWSKVAKCNLNDRNSLKLDYCTQFSSFHSGVNFYTESGLSDVFEDCIRFNTEKCDTLRGFTMLYDSNTGYGGFVSRLYPLLDDVYGKKAKLTLSLGDDKTPNIFDVECVTGNSVCSFWDWNSPPSFENLLIKDTDYHRAALYSTALYQLHQMFNTGVHLKDFTSFISPLSRNIFSTSLGLPFDNTEVENKFESLFCKKYFENSIQHLSAYSTKLDVPLHNTYVSCSDLPHITTTHHFYSNLTKLQQDNKLFASSTKYCYSSTPMGLSPNFPQFFNNMILSNGRLRCKQKSRTRPVDSLPVVVVLQNSKSCANLVNQVLEKKISVNKCTDLLTAGVLEEDIADMRQRLHELADNYNL